MNIFKIKNKLIFLIVTGFFNSVRKYDYDNSVIKLYNR